MKKNVLVFPCGSEIGLEIYRSLQYSTHFSVFGGSSLSDHGKFVYQKYIDKVPFVDDKNFIEKLNSIINNNKIDFIFPAHDSVVLKLAKAQNDGNLDCKVITSPLETCKLTRSKQHTYNFFQSTISVPKIFESDSVDQKDLPIFLKPDVGQGSKGTHKAKTTAEINFYKKTNSSLICIEYLPGKEFTVDCFTSKEGKLLFCEGRQRRRISSGISVDSVSVADERFRQIANKINDKIKLRGVWFFQVKANTKGQLVLMEIAPRVAGTMGLVRCKGVNLPLLSLFDAMDLKVSIIENNFNIEIDRALENKYKHSIKYKHVYLDFDDLVIVEGKVNPSVMAFVFQSHNNGILIHLLTRHDDVLEKNLKKYKLSGLFDEIIWIKDGSKKSVYIKHQDAIFIDDSFAERQEVSDTLKIPVFDAHMIESLME